MDNVTIIIVLFLVIGGYLLTTNQVTGSAYLILVIFTVIALVIFVMNLSMFKSYTQVLDSATDATMTSTLSEYTQRSTEYSISSWIYINDWSTKSGMPKVIMTRADNPSIVLDSYKNDLLVKFQTFKSDKSSEGGGPVEIRIPNISIQKWVNITVCFGNKNVDTYINGKLVNTYVTSFPQFITITPKASKPPPFSITPGGGFSGSISQCRYYDRLLTPKEAWDIYNSGVNGNFLNQYSASFKFYNNDVPTEFWIF